MPTYMILRKPKTAEVFAGYNHDGYSDTGMVKWCSTSDAAPAAQTGIEVVLFPNHAATEQARNQILSLTGIKADVVPIQIMSIF